MDFKEAKEKSWNFYNGLIISGVVLLVLIGYFVERYITALNPNKVIPCYYISVSILMLLSTRKNFLMMIKTNMIDTYEDRQIYMYPSLPEENIIKTSVEKYQSKSLGAFGNGATSLITAYVYSMLFNAYIGKYSSCIPLLFFLYLNLIIYLYISIKVIYKKTGIMYYFDIGNETIVSAILVFAVYFLCIKKIPSINNSFLTSFSEFVKKVSFWNIVFKYIPLFFIKPIIDIIFKSVEQKHARRGTPVT